MTGTDQHSGFASWVGRSETTQDVASRSAAIGLGALLDRPLDPEASDAAALFPLGHWLQFTPTAAMSELGADGHPRLGGFIPAMSLPRRMWAGSKITFQIPVIVGQRLARVTTIESITPKNGASGRLCFVVLRHDIASEGRPAIVEHQTLVYRAAVTVDQAAATHRPPRSAGPAPDGLDWTRTQQPDETTLFRFSALTFNSHRIHYDLPYATGVEGYPGLVVHGPLSATYMVDAFLHENPSARITDFEFSARAPIFANESVYVCGRTAGRGVTELAVIAPDGQAAVTARIKIHTNRE